MAPSHDDARAREERVRGVVPLAEGEDVEAFRACLQRVRVLEREMDEAVARSDRVGGLLRPVPLDGDARPAEDVEDLLL